MGDIETILKIIFVLIGFGAILFLTYVTTRYIAKKQIGMTKGRNISILETVMLGADKRLHLVKAGKSYILIATTSKSVEFLASVEPDEAEEAEDTSENSGTRFDFRSLFEKYGNMYRTRDKKKKDVKNPALDGDEQDGPTFRKNLERLKIILNKSRNEDIGEDGDDDTNDKEEESS